MKAQNSCQKGSNLKCSQQLPENLPQEIGGSSYLPIVWKHLTPAVCQEIFEQTRDRERQRKWSLYALLRTWTGLLQTDLESQTQAIESYCGTGHPLFPNVKASPESFFMRIQQVRPAFFRNLFNHFTQAIKGEFPGNFEVDSEVSENKFSHVYSIDASRLERVEKRLKILRNVHQPIIPGSLQGAYDLRNGCLKALYFDPDGDKGEIPMLEEILPKLEAESLILADALYCVPHVWQEVAEKDIFMISPYHTWVKQKKIKELGRHSIERGVISDTLVQMGTYQRKMILRSIRLHRKGKKTFQLITNILDPKLLTAKKILALYKKRWTIERMYFHLKEVLNLNYLFNSSPAAVGQQVYATAILYNALRLSQALIAKKLKVKPELISPAKLFPRITEILVRLTLAEIGAELMYEAVCEKNPRFKVDRPQLNWNHHPFFRLQLKGLWVEKRNPKRKKRKYHKFKSWTSFHLIRGGRAYMQN
jgi:hypothetical protein